MCAAMMLMNIGFVAMIKNGAERTLEMLALQDCLTRLWDLTELGIWVGERFVGSSPPVAPSSIVVVEIDRLKAINNRCRHDFGVKALVHMADVFRANCRQIIML
jgi:GGDEF domain-containing protein